MFTPNTRPRKRRTREHVIASQSINYVERFILGAGFVTQAIHGDYGYDLFVLTFDGEGYCEPGQVFMQLKSTDHVEYSRNGSECMYDLAVKDYNLWMDEIMPVVVVLFDAKKQRAWWLYLQRYFAQDGAVLPRQNAKTTRVYIPFKQRFGPRTPLAMRGWKSEILSKSWGKIGHA